MKITKKVIIHFPKDDFRPSGSELIDGVNVEYVSFPDAEDNYTEIRFVNGETYATTLPVTLITFDNGK